MLRASRVVRDVSATWAASQRRLVSVCGVGRSSSSHSSLVPVKWSRSLSSKMGEGGGDSSSSSSLPQAACRPLAKHWVGSQDTRPPLPHSLGLHDMINSVLPPSKDVASSSSSPPPRPAALSASELPPVPAIHFGTGTLAALATSSCVAVSGGNTILATVTYVRDPSSSSSSSSPPSSAAAPTSPLSPDDSFVPLTVSYSERSHAAGRIPSTPTRRDNQQPGESETLGSRVVDRVVRPLLLNTGGKVYGPGATITVTCAVQSTTRPPPPSSSSSSSSLPSVGAHCHDALPLSVNAALAALQLAAGRKGGVVMASGAGCVRVALFKDEKGGAGGGGKGGKDSSAPSSSTNNNNNNQSSATTKRSRGRLVVAPSPTELLSCSAELLYAGTRDCALMVEFASKASGASSDPGVPEEELGEMLRVAHLAIKPIIAAQEDLVNLVQASRDGAHKIRKETKAVAAEAAETLPLPSDSPDDATNPAPKTDDEATEDKWTAEAPASQQPPPDAESSIWDQVYGRFADKATELFKGVDGENSKSARGARQGKLTSEVADFLATFPQGSGAGGDSARLVTPVMERLFKAGMRSAALGASAGNDSRGGRMDGRSLLEVRDVEAAAPCLPDSVHGSSIFRRGETQVLCTVTLGEPSEGVPIRDPLAPKMQGRQNVLLGNGADGLPVGSLRSLKTDPLLSMVEARRIGAGSVPDGAGGAFDPLESKRAFLHYDFPGYSVGEAASGGASANRRSIGHGMLAEKAVLPSLPSTADFPYTIRMTSEVTASNGSSSMASVCGATMALLDAGVPVRHPVAGVSVGLVTREGAIVDGSTYKGGKDDYALLLDINGTEDHYGDMDFKVAGTKGGVTALQLDVKLPGGVPVEVLIEALSTGRAGREIIFEKMAEGLSYTRTKTLKPRRVLKDSAPRVEIVRYPPDRKKDIVGPGGAVLTQLEERYGVALDLTQEGQCLIYGEGAETSTEGRGVKAARNAIQELVGEVIKDAVYEAVVLEIKDFGAIVEIMRNKEGLLHVAEITDDASLLKSATGNQGVVGNLLCVGQKIDLLCTDVDKIRGSIKLSRKQLVRRQMQSGMSLGNSSAPEIGKEPGAIPSWAAPKAGSFVYEDEELTRSRKVAMQLGQLRANQLAEENGKIASGAGDSTGNSKFSSSQSSPKARAEGNSSRPYYENRDSARRREFEFERANEKEAKGLAGPDRRKQESRPSSSGRDGSSSGRGSPDRASARESERDRKGRPPRSSSSSRSASPSNSRSKR